MNEPLREAQKEVDFWRQKVRERQETVGRFFATQADREDLSFAEGRLRDAESRLARSRQS